MINSGIYLKTWDSSFLPLNWPDFFLVIFNDILISVTSCLDGGWRFDEFSCDGHHDSVRNNFAYP